MPVYLNKLYKLAGWYVPKNQKRNWAYDHKWFAQTAALRLSGYDSVKESEMPKIFVTVNPGIGK